MWEQEAIPTSPWWDGDWKYRCPVLIFNRLKRPLINYSFWLFIDSETLLALNKVQYYGEDLRLVSYSAWSKQTVYNICITKWFRKTARVYWKDSLAPGQYKVYWLYYGNLDAEPGPRDELKTFLHGDHFENQVSGETPDPNRWDYTFVPGRTSALVSDWEAYQRRSICLRATAPGGSVAMDSKPYEIREDFHFHCMIVRNAMRGQAGVTFFLPNYIAVFGVVLYANGNVTAFSIVDQWTHPKPWYVGVYHSLDIKYRFTQRSFSVCWDDAPWLSDKKLDMDDFALWGIDPTWMKYYQIGQYSLQTVSTWVDDILIRKVAEPDPLYHMYGEEEGPGPA